MPIVFGQLPNCALVKNVSLDAQHVGTTSKQMSAVRQVTLIVRSIGTKADACSGGSSLGAAEPSEPGPSDAVEEGPIRLEAVVSADRARTIVDAMIQGADTMAALERTLETVVEREMESTETHGSLFECLMSTVERIVIGRVYESCQGVQTQAAEHLGINRNTLHKKLCKHKLLLATQPFESIDP